MCGLTRKQDVLAAYKAGADVAGFIFVSSSPRCTTEKFLKEVRKIPILKVAVVKDPDKRFIRKLRAWLRAGLIDGVQFHGRESADLVYSFYGSAYKATIDTELKVLPITLYDSLKTVSMRKGRALPSKVYKNIYGQWLAGGLTPQNVRAMIKAIDPGLLDVNSGIEFAPGLKDRHKLKQFMKEVQRG